MKHKVLLIGKRLVLREQSNSIAPIVEHVSVICSLLPLLVLTWYLVQTLRVWN